MERTVDFFLSHPELVTPTSPWCVRVDNLELGTLLLAQPWLVGEGIRRATLERRLAALAADLPLGAIYFQRVKRAVTHLVSIGAMDTIGEGRACRFVTTPRGFATLLINLRVVDADPTVDGAEFELKRALVSMWSLVLEQLNEVPDAALPAPSTPTERFFEQVEALEVLGTRLIDDAFVEEAFDVLRLIAEQRRQVTLLLEIAEVRLAGAETAARSAESIDLTRLVPETLAPGIFDDPSLEAARRAGTLALVQHRVEGVLPTLHARASIDRYRQG